MQIVNKYLFLITTPQIILLFFSLFLGQVSHSASAQEVYKVRKVVIDPGHGGKDSGAIGRKSKEKDIVLSVSLKLGEYIAKNFPDVEVIYTRKEDVFVPVHMRSKMANEHAADLFISIHCNSNPSREPYGSETYVMGLNKTQSNLDVAMRENAVITYEEDYTTKYEGYDPNSPESYIIFSLMQNAFLEQSLNIASFIQDEFRERVKRRDRGVKQEGFLVLWQNSMPSVLVELGFISNAREEEYLVTSEAHTHFASAIYRAFRNYKKMIEERSTFTTVKQEEIVVEPPKTEVNVSDGVMYRVQITASRKSIPTESNFFKNFKGVEELPIDGLFKYVIGSLSNYEESMKLCEQVRVHFPDAFIIAFKDGLPISLEQARILTNK